MHLQARRSARLVARPILQPGSSYHLKTMMQWYLRKKNSHDASVRGNSWNSALRKLKAHECRASKIDHITYQPNSVWCCPVLVPRKDPVVPAGVAESMPGGDLPKRCHSETLQQDGPQGNLVGEPFWYHCKPLEFGRSEANLTTTPLEPLWRAWICRSYSQDAVGTWRCPVAVAHLHEMTWPHCNISPASIPPKLVKLIVFLPRAALVPVLLRCASLCAFFFGPGTFSLGILRICNFLTLSGTFYRCPCANFQYPRKISTDVALIAPWAHPLSARRRASVWQWITNQSLNMATFCKPHSQPH